MGETSAACKFCGGPTLPATRIVAGIRARNNGAGPGTEPTGYFCCVPCQCAQLSRAAARSKCVGFQCSRPAAVAKATGRPAEYCGEQCRRNTERVIERTLRDLVRDRLPDKLPDLDAMLDRLTFLEGAWSAGRVARVRHGRWFPRPRIEVSDAAWRSLRKLISRANRLRSKLVDHAHREAREREYAEAAERRAAIQMANYEAGEAWRHDLAAALDASPGVGAVASGSDLRQMRERS